MSDTPKEPRGQEEAPAPDSGQEAAAGTTLPFEEQERAQAPERTTTVGQELRRERELREITLQEISEDTKISIRNLKAIEDNEWHRLPGGIYTKNFIRAYCRYLGINEEKMVNQYLYQTSPREPSSGRDSMRDRLAIADAPAWRTPVMVAAGVLGLVILLALAWSQPAWFGLSAETPAPPGPGPVPTGTERLGPPVPLNFTFRADDDTWVVVEVDGQPRMQRILKQGEFFEVKAQEDLRLSVEDAGVLAWTINGRTARSLGDRGEVVSNLVIGQENWREWVSSGSDGGG